MAWISRGWKEYEVLDATQGLRLESWAGKLLVRPDPQVIWATERKDPRWNRFDAKYHRSSTGGGRWEIRSLPESWLLHYKDDLTFHVKPMNFKHTGVFPEQAANWDYIREKVEGAGRPIRVLNLFAYSGGATLAAAAGGAEVWHVDAAKGMVAMAKENAAASGLADRPIHWIVDDCGKFIQREIRRGRKYDVREILSENPLFVIINSYTTGLAPSAVGYMADAVFGARFGGCTQCGELGLPVAASGLTLPCGAAGRWEPGR